MSVTLTRLGGSGLPTTLLASALPRFRVLCVDDDPQVLEGLALQLRPRFEVLKATSGAAALEILRTSGEVAVIISDMRMPGMNGAAFLREACRIAPRASRILLTGQADSESAAAAVNDGQIFRFLSKPCPPASLLSAVMSGLNGYRLALAKSLLIDSDALSPGGVRSVLNRVLNLARGLFSCRYIALGVNPRENELAIEVLAHDGDPQQMRSAIEAASPGIFQRLLREEGSIRLETRSPTLLPETFAQTPTTVAHLLGVPLVSASKCHGWLCLADVAAGTGFTADDEAVAMALARSAAILYEKASLDALAHSQASLLDQAKDAIVLRSLDGRVRYWNKGAERLYGWTAEEAIGERMTPVLDENAALLDVAIRQVLRTGEWSGQMSERHKDGRVIPTEAHWTLVSDPEGRPQSILGINTDISRRLAVEAQLRQSQRLESVGQLTGGVAHDFNNLLTVILGNSELLLEKLAGQPDLLDLAEMTHSAAQKGADLTNRLLAFARRQNLNPSAVDINRLIAGMAGLLRRTLSENIALERRTDPELWCSLVDPSQLEAALLNLCINSRDAMPRGGRLLIELSNLRVSDQQPADPGELQPGEYVRIRVVDNGAGIAPDDLPRVFEPFFTTKEFGKGTGLGLSMVYGFVKQSQGHLAVESVLERGTTVTLYLPRASDASTARSELPARHALRGTESILLAEDDPLVRRFAADQLRHLGYTVTEVEDGVVALGVLSTRAPVDLLFTDVVMPGGLSGPELVEAARRIRPGLRALYSSGYTESAMDDLSPEQKALLLRKPYQRVELAQKIRAALSDSDDG